MKLIKEDDNFILYSPALDLSGYGDSEGEAETSFELALEEFMRYSSAKNTTKQALVDLGWTFTHTGKRKKRLIAPPLYQMLERDEYLSNIFDEKPFHKFNKTVHIPEFA